MSDQQVALLQDLLARVQRNAARPRSPASNASALELPEPPFAAPAYQVPSETLDPALDEMLLPDPFPSVPPPAAAAENQPSLIDMLDDEPPPVVSVSSEPLLPGDDLSLPGEDISGVMNRSELQDEAPEELLEDDIVEMSPVSSAPAASRGLDGLDFEDELTGERPTSAEEPPVSSSRTKAAPAIDDALAQGANPIDLEEREVPLKTPPPESGPQAAVGAHAPLAPDIEELLEADIVPVGGTNKNLPTAEQLGQTIDLEDARGPQLELDSALAPPPDAAHAHEELEASIPPREFGGGYQDDLMPPPEARQDLDAHRQRVNDEPAPESPVEHSSSPRGAEPPVEYPSSPRGAEPPVEYPSSPRAPALSSGFAPASPQTVTTDSFTEHVPMVTVDAPPNAEFAPELLTRPELAPAPIAKFIRAEAPRPRTFLELLDSSLALGGSDW